MNDPLNIYLHDHLAGADFAIDLLQAMKERQIETPSGTFVGLLLAKVEEDRDTLKKLADRIGCGSNISKSSQHGWAQKPAA